MILSPEVFDVLKKLMKSDEENGTVDVQLLCKLFSGESSTYHFSTENTRVIKAETPLYILGSTQLTNVDKLIERMEHWHGLVLSSNINPKSYMILFLNKCFILQQLK